MHKHFLFFVCQLVQIIPMARTVGKHVDSVHRMLHVTREVVYVQMAVTAAIDPQCARSVSTLCILKQLWETDIFYFRMHSIPSSIIWFSRVIRRQTNGNPVNMRIPCEGIFLSCKWSYFSNIILQEMYKAYLCILSHDECSLAEGDQICATRYKTSYRLLTVGPKLLLHCYV